MIALKRILVPTDFSETSEAAVKYGVAFARAFGAKLFLLHVAVRQDLELMLERERAVQQGLSDGAPPSLSLEDIVQSAAREMLGQLLTDPEKDELQTEYVLRPGGVGGPYVEIVRYAQQHNIDLIVMGTHGGGFVAHMLMGSVADKVVRKAPCPVLTVRHPEHEFVIPDEPVQGHSTTLPRAGAQSPEPGMSTGL